MFIALREVRELALAAYRDVAWLWQQARPTLLAAVVLVAIGAVAGSLVPSLVGTAIGRLLAGTLTGIGALYFAAPYLVALTHSIAYGDPVSGSQFRNSDSAERYFAWGALLSFVALLPDLMAVLAGPRAMVFQFLTMIALVYLSVRVATLLPGVALEGRAMTLRRSLHSTAGRFWYISFAFACLMLPILALGIPLAMLLGIGGVATVIGSPLLGIAVIALFPILLIAGLALSVRLHLRFTTPPPATDA